MLDFITRGFRSNDRDRIGAIDGGPRGLSGKRVVRMDFARVVSGQLTANPEAAGRPPGEGKSLRRAGRPSHLNQRPCLTSPSTSS